MKSRDEVSLSSVEVGLEVWRPQQHLPADLVDVPLVPDRGLLDDGKLTLVSLLHAAH